MSGKARCSPRQALPVCRAFRTLFAHVERADPVLAMSSAPNGERKGPLVGLRVIELVGLEPGPFTAMLLADLGADVLRIDRVARANASTQLEQLTQMREHDLLARGRPSVGVELKHPRGAALALRSIAQSDIAIAHPHARARRGYVDVAGVPQPAPAPRFSRTPAGIPAPPSLPGADTASALEAWGVDAADIAALREHAIIANLP